MTASIPVSLLRLDVLGNKSVPVGEYYRIIARTGNGVTLFLMLRQQPVDYGRVCVRLLSGRAMPRVRIFDVLNGRTGFLEVRGQSPRAVHRYPFIARTMKDS